MEKVMKRVQKMVSGSSVSKMGNMPSPTSSKDGTKANVREDTDPTRMARGKAQFLIN